MKIRESFVANSSSSSFIIKKKYLSPYQIDRIFNYVEESKDMIGLDHDHNDFDRWVIDQDQDVIKGETFMDNFDMRYFLDIIGVDERHIKWGD